MDPSSDEAAYFDFRSFLCSRFRWFFPRLPRWWSLHENFKPFQFGFCITNLQLRNGVERTANYFESKKKNLFLHCVTWFQVKLALIYIRPFTGLASFAAKPPRRGAGGYNDPGAHGLWEAHGLQEGRWLQRNDTEKSACQAWRPFFLKITWFRPEKPLEFPWRPFFFLWRSHQFSDQTTAFSPSILDFMKPKSVILELAPGPLLVPGGPALRFRR